MKKVNRLITATIVLTTALSPLTVFGAPVTAGTPNTTTVEAGKDTNSATVAAGKAELTLGDTTQVTSDLTLPSGKGGLKITWSTSDATVVTDAGVVTRAAFLVGDRTATLTATIRKGNVTDTKDFTVTVKKLPETRQEAVFVANEAIAAVPSADAITFDTLSDAQAKVKTAHDDITVAQNLGAVDADFVGLDRLAAADAKITDLLNIQAVETDKSALDIQFADGESATAVKHNITLPTTGANGTTIAWATSDAGVVATDGTVTRPAVDAGNATAVLTATITKGNATDTKVFELTVDEREAVHVQLLTMNDLHGKIDQTYQEDINHDGVKESLGRMDYMEAYFKQYEAMNPNTLVVHSGDATGGSAPVSALFNDEPTVNVLNAMGMSVGTVGNHEFDRGTQELLRLINGGDSPKGFAGYQGMNYPLLAANVVYKDSGKLVLPAYEIKEVGGVKVGFIGVVTQSAAGMVMPSGIQDIQFTDETKAVNDAAAELEAQGVHAIVVLAHMDATQNGDVITGQAADLAKNADPDIDVILAAHNHTIVNGTVNGKLITQAYEYGKAFGDVNLDIDPGTDDIVHKTATIVYNDQSKVQPDADVSALIQKYEDLVAPKLNEVEGQAAIPMVGGYTNTGDNALGNLIADSMKTAMHSDFAMVNGGGIRDSLSAGPITWNELFNILPFNNILESVQVKGSDMVTIINNQLSKYYGPDFSVAGLKYTYNLSTAKVENVFLPDGSKIDPNKTYTLTVNNFMATATAFKYASIGKLGTNPVTGPEDLPALVDYVKNYQGALAYQSEGRITPANTLQVTNNSGATDTVYVNKLYAGDKVRVYASATATTPLAEATVASGQNSVLITGLDLGANAGTAYVSVVSGGKTEGPKMPVNYSAE